ncbi:MAG: putative PEP-CTERM system histidine kinase [Paraglaciecola sp.]|jgi:putative PEP-CTERM system histidine kinase
MLAIWGYGISATGYTLLLLLLLTVRKSGLAKYLLILATAATCLWSLSPFLGGVFSINKLLFYDNIKQLFWLLFLASCLKDNFSNIADVMRRPETWLILILPLLALVLPLIINLADTWKFLLQTAMALQVLILLEIIYRQAGDNRWAFKPLVLYLGATNLFEFVTFANALMVEQIDLTYIAARGFIYFALIPFLVLAIRRVQNWGVNIFVSRDVVLHSSLLVVAGGYLFIMALIGYGVLYFGGQWSATVQVVMIFLSLALLATLFLSAGFRTRIKVFITKHFFANQFDYRIEWLKLTRALENTGPNENVYHTALQAFLQAIDYESGILIRKADSEIVYLAEIDRDPLNADEISLIGKFFEYFTHKNWIIDITELSTKPFMYEDLKVKSISLNRVSFHLVVPIYREETLWGILALSNRENPDRTLNWELRDYLTAVTAQVTNFLFHHEVAKEVAENGQFVTFSRMSAFVLHDLKNILAQIELILSNAQQHKDNPEFIDDTFETLEHTKARMEKMLRQLSEKSAEQGKSQSLCQLSVCIDEVLTQRCASQLPLVTLEVHSETDVVLDKDKLSNVIYHLASNAQQATGDDGFVRIDISQSDNLKQMLVKISDNGSGMSKDFIQRRLFKPFDTTKGNAGMGIGAYDAKLFMEQIGGYIQVKSEVGVGTTFTLIIPAD